MVKKITRPAGRKGNRKGTKRLEGRVRTYLTEKELAQRLGFSERTVQGWRGRGSGPPYRRVGRRAIRYIWEECEAWVNENRFSSTSQYGMEKTHSEDDEGPR